MSAPRSPLRWRRVPNPEKYDFAVQLVRDGKVLATAYRDGRWTARALAGEGQAPDQAGAKAQALAFVRKALADAAGES